MKKILFLVGPTGVGKSEIALALTKKLNGEIISCDAMQVYRGMDLGTAKPTASDQKRVRHHLIDLISPRAECSVFQYRALALKAIQHISSKDLLPIAVGGSGFYIKALIDGMMPHPARESSFRKELEDLSTREGVSVLYSRLKEIDLKRAQAIHPNDERRIIRALEIFEQSRQKPSEWNLKNETLTAHGFQPVIFGFRRERAELYERIEGRVDQMFEAGWVQEVKKLKARGFSRTARGAIGYQEILEYLNGKCTLEEAILRTKKRTRHLAKKQMTWFRKDRRIKWISIEGGRFKLRASKQIIKTLNLKGFYSHAS